MACEHCPTCGGETRLVDDVHQSVLPNASVIQGRISHLKAVAQCLSEEHLLRPGSLKEERLIEDLLKLLKVKPAQKPVMTVDQCRERIAQQLNG